MKTVALLLSFLALTSSAKADCVYGVKSSTKYRVLDQHTLLLEGSFAGSFLLKSFSFFNTYSRITILKDSFCDYASDVLYVDGMTVSVQEVKHLQ